jgi:hypothetical protein
MSKNGGCLDTDRGMEEIRKQIEALGNKAVKAGIVEGSGSVDGVDIAQYGAWNEYGVPGPPYSENGDGVWFIPPRPFIRGWLENNAEKIKTTQEKLYKQVSEGKMFAVSAINRLGQFSQDGIKRYIKSGDFTPNAESTKRRKKSSRPLIDTGAMRNSIRYEIVEGGGE